MSEKLPYSLIHVPHTIIWRGNEIKKDEQVEYFATLEELDKKIYSYMESAEAWKEKKTNYCMKILLILLHL